MNELPLERRSVLEMALVEGMSHSEIAAVAGLPLGTIETMIRSASQH
jgi:DNA-directed RNA polymerase specialized sigma24 family protein